MNVLITGAFGNIGRLVIEALRDDHVITAFDLKTPANVKVSAAYQDDVSITWGDINDESILLSCLAEQDAIIHLAAVLPPFTEINPELAYRVNVEGTRSLLNIANRQAKNPLFVFASSFAVFGHQQEKAPPRTVSDPLYITDNYSRHKVECEAMIQEQALPWAILRLGACLDGKHLSADKESMQMAVNTRADNRIEFVYPVDVATAIKHSVERKDAHNKIHLIGGGKSCQITHMEMLNVMLGAAGMRFDAEDFGEQAFYTDWMDTGESQRILEFQNHDLNDLKAEAYAKLKYVRWVVRPISPIVKAAFLRWLA